jgi:hypothetical protein
VLTVCDNTKVELSGVRKAVGLHHSVNVPAEVEGTDEKRPGALANVPG